MAQSGREISVKDYSTMISGTCPVSLASSCLPTDIYSIGTDPVCPVCPGTQTRSIVVQKTVSNHKNTDDPKKGCEETSDPGLQEWAAAQLPHVENNKEDIEWRTLKHPGLGLILVGIMAGAICWIGRRKYPAKDSPDFGLRDERPDYYPCGNIDAYWSPCSSFDYPCGNIDAYWSPCSSIDTEPDSSSDEEEPDPDKALTSGEIPPRHRKMPKETPDHPSMGGNRHTYPQLPVVKNLGSATAPDLQS